MIFLICLYHIKEIKIISENYTINRKKVKVYDDELFFEHIDIFIQYFASVRF
jgi:hypothetical protein